jgi:hypothetical protein
MTCVLVAECIAWLFYEDRGVGPDLGAYLAHLHSPRNVKFGIIDHLNVLSGCG